MCLEGKWTGLDGKIRVLGGPQEAAGGQFAENALFLTDLTHIVNCGGGSQPREDISDCINVMKFAEAGNMK
jgi:hypothetical protein